MLIKIQEVAEILATSEIEALRFASRLKCLGSYRNRVQTAWAAYTNPSFYRELGKNPEELVADGISALREIIAKG